MPMFLVALRKWDDTYYRTVVSELDTPELNKLRELARNRDFRVDCERLDTIEDMEDFLTS